MHSNWSSSNFLIDAYTLFLGRLKQVLIFPNHYDATTETMLPVGFVHVHVQN